MPNTGRIGRTDDGSDVIGRPDVVEDDEDGKGRWMNDALLVYVETPTYLDFPSDTFPMRCIKTIFVLLLIAAPTLVAAPGCSTLQQIAALRQVAFGLDRVSNGRLAGVPIDNVRSYNNIGVVDAGRIAVALAQGSMPLDFVLHVGAENPTGNSTPARLVQLDWTLFVDGTETVSGIFNDERLIEPGQRVDLPVSIRLDLVRLVGNNLPDLANLALNLAGAGGSPARLRLEARPSITTEFGPIRYPGTISISQTVGR